MAIGWPISAAEYETRRNSAAQQAVDRGLKGLVIWSKGGGTVDRFADVMYLTNHYGQFPHIQERRPMWSGRSYSVVVLPGEGEATLIVDIPDYRRDLVFLDDVRYALDVPQLTAQVMREKGMAEGPVGLVASESLVLAPDGALLEPLPGINFQPADDILDEMRQIKSPAELELLRHACAVGSDVVTAILQAARPGISEAEAVSEGLRVMALNGAQGNILSASGPNSQYYTYMRCPTYDHTRTLERGDLMHVDMYGYVDGYFWDLTRSTVIGGRPSKPQRRILEDTIRLVEEIISGITTGKTTEDLARIGKNFMTRAGYAGELTGNDDVATAALAQSFPAFGHGLGLGWENPWIVEGDPTLIQPNMVFAVECALGLPNVGAAGYEETVIVHEDHVEVIVTAQKRWWQ